MKLFLTIGGLAPEFGGPSQSVPALAEAVARENVDVELIACESLPGQSAPRIPNKQLVPTRLVPVRSRQGRWRARRNDFFLALAAAARGDGVVIHDNGLWLPTNHAVARAAQFLNRPLLISPRGMLSPWERKHHGLKKKVAWTLFQRSDLFSAAALHATSEEEAAAFRDAGYHRPIAIVPNGVDLPINEGRSEMEDRNARKSTREVHTALCVTRIHPKKGLLELIEAWSEVRPTGWRMIIAGADENGHREQLEAAIAERGLQAVFEFVGPVDTQGKQALYSKADLFILPSHSENFGMSIAEALANSLPVITTRGTPWKDLVEHHCGWWVEVSAAPLAKALLEATSLSDEKRQEMGELGRALVRQKYSWSHVAKKMKSVYEWLIGQRDRPNCVVET